MVESPATVRVLGFAQEWQAEIGHKQRVVGMTYGAGIFLFIGSHIFGFVPTPSHDLPKRRGFFVLLHQRLVTRLLDSKLRDQPMQISARDTERACALRLAPATFPEGTQHQPALELAYFFLIRLVELRSLATAANRGRQLPNVYGWTFRENHGALHGVFQFAHVAGPSIFLERAKGGLRKALGLLFKSLGEVLQKMLRE